jgi:hypothetical protein
MDKETISPTEIGKRRPRRRRPTKWDCKCGARPDENHRPGCGTELIEGVE